MVTTRPGTWIFRMNALCMRSAIRASAIRASAIRASGHPSIWPSGHLTIRASAIRASAIRSSEHLTTSIWPDYRCHSSVSICKASALDRMVR